MMSGPRNTTDPRPAGLHETRRALLGVWKSRRRNPTKNANPAYAHFAVLSRNPLIVYAPLTSGPLGFAGWAHRVGVAADATFILFPWWSIETARDAKRLRHHAVVHRLRFPRQRLLFVCNTQAEADLLLDFGEYAVAINSNSTVSDRIFRPIPNAKIEYDAIYNARLAPWKRHELTLAVERCAFLFYRVTESSEMEQALIERHRREAPGHHFINRFDENGVPCRISPADVNMQLNRAAVGLCLSAREGTMYSSMEYLLAGLPIVSTPSHGGRDTYFDPEFCLIVDPDPRAVRDAVRALAERQIPREVIRSRTLERIERDRRRFIDLLNEVLAGYEAPPRFEMPWPFERSTLVSRVATDSIAATLAVEEVRTTTQRVSPTDAKRP